MRVVPVQSLSSFCGSTFSGIQEIFIAVCHITANSEAEKDIPVVQWSERASRDGLEMLLYSGQRDPAEGAGGSS